jgi:hypothetical protein
MSVRFENNKDLERELGCIEFFCNTFGLTYSKLGENDIDFSIYKNGELISYAEVKGRNRNINDAYPLPIACRKLVKLQDKKVNPIIIWACYDGIIYGKTKEIYGMVYTGGRKPREKSVNDIEFMAYFTKQSKLIEKYF